MRQYLRVTQTYLLTQQLKLHLWQSSWTPGGCEATHPDGERFKENRKVDHVSVENM